MSNLLSSAADQLWASYKWEAFERQNPLPKDPIEYFMHVQSQLQLTSSETLRVFVKFLRTRQKELISKIHSIESQVKVQG